MEDLLGEAVINLGLLAGFLISAYIELAQQNFYDDAQIIDDLSGIFTRKDLEELGYGDFIKDYFDDGEG